MTKIISKSVFCFLGLLVFSAVSSAQKDGMVFYNEIDRNAPLNTLTKNEQLAGWQLLFNGKTGKGWHGYNLTGFPDCWVIKDGTLTMTTEGKTESQDITTDKKYYKFAFSIDVKLTKGANSGIIFQVSEDKKYKQPYETGPEFQIIDQDNWKDKLEDWQINGANYAMYPPISKPANPVGEWDHLLLLVDGNNVTQIINGVVVVKYVKYSDDWVKLRKSGKWSDYPDYGKFDDGFIDLQNHGTQVFFRNIKIKELK